MADCLDRKLILNALYDEDAITMHGVAIINTFPAADVVPTSVYRQVAWERDTAIEQLHSIGKEFGEKMDDVAPVVHGEWLFDRSAGIKSYFKCNVCGRYVAAFADEQKGKRDVCEAFPYCHCGAKMDLGVYDA